jgi:hypothetical protein
MKKIITPGIFLLAALLSSACTETDDIDTDADEPQDEQPTDVAPCCAPDSPRGDELVFDSFDTGRNARLRFDWLRQLRSK